VFDPARRDFSNIHWVGHDWKQFYPDINGEIMPIGRPRPRGKSVQISIFCDAAYGACHVTRRSTTGIVKFINGAPIQAYSKRQNTIETSTFGSEFVALKIAAEMNEALRYKLRMMGVEVDGPTNCFCDNKSVVTNKKNNFIAYHKVRESVASESIRIAHEKGTNNLADMLTKFLPAPTFKKCVQCILMV
jgi:capsule polysaccharide modification protein KpsS